MFSKEWINPNKVEYFNILDYLSQLKLSDNVLFHNEDTYEEMGKYIKELGNYCDYQNNEVLCNWLDRSMLGLPNYKNIDGFTKKDIVDSDIFFDKDEISHERIKRVHEFVGTHSETGAKVVGEYRSDVASIGVMIDKDNYQPFWYGAEAKDIERFIDSFIEYYRTDDNKEVFNNPLIRASLVHLLLMRIHPFGNGNKRSIRVLQDIALASELNRISNTNLRVLPLNTTISMYMYRDDYTDRLARVFFDLEHKEENNIAINRWIDFMLNIYDEQLCFYSNKLSSLK